MMKKISELVPGDLVDLYLDQYADPDDSDMSNDFEFEYQRVVEVIPETTGCTLVHFEFVAVGFPPDHVVEVVG